MTAALLRPLRSVLQRDRQSRRLVVEAALIVTSVRLGLTVIPYRILRLVRRPALRVAASIAADRCDPTALVAAIRVAARHVPSASCLTQAIALHIMMTRRGMQSVIELGVTRRDGRFAAHAWVRHGDVALIGGDVASYRPLRRAGSSA